MTTATDRYFMKIICFCTTVFCTFAKNFDSFQSNLFDKKFNKRQESRASSEKEGAKTTTFARGDC